MVWYAFSLFAVMDWLLNNNILSIMALEKKYAVDSKIGNSHYDALQDKHASFYFNGYGVKKHLKKLKKVCVCGSRS